MAAGAKLLCQSAAWSCEAEDDTLMISRVSSYLVSCIYLLVLL